MASSLNLVNNNHTWLTGPWKHAHCRTCDQISGLQSSSEADSEKAQGCAFVDRRSGQKLLSAFLVKSQEGDGQKVKSSSQKLQSKQRHTEILRDSLSLSRSQGEPSSWPELRAALVPYGCSDWTQHRSAERQYSQRNHLKHGTANLRLWTSQCSVG